MGARTDRAGNRAGNKAADEVKEEILGMVDSLRHVVEDIVVSLYEHPETGLEEVFAARKLTGILAQAGFGIEKGLAGMPTAFAARSGTRRPAIAFMAEYDALPGIGHGCGHNLIAASAVAAGIAMKRLFPPDQKERPARPSAGWIVLGTPAEETVGGKVAMVESGVFSDIDAALLAHPGQRNSVGGGVHWASHPLQIDFRGKASHAGLNPGAGVNALDACVAAYTAIRNLRNQFRDEVRIAGIISCGGEAQNVVPDRTQMKFTLRSTDWKYLEDVVVPRVRKCAEGAAASYGAEVKFRHHEPLFRETLDYPLLMDLARANFEYLGEEIPPPLPLEGGGVTDVGNVTWVTPSIQVGYRAASARGHSREMAEATVTPEGIAACLTAAKVMALTALDLASDPSLLLQAKEHLAKQRGLA